MPEYFYLLFKGISLIEGVGRSINPDLDVVKSLKPFTKNILLRKVSPRKVWQTGTEKLLNLTDNIEEIPKEIRSVLQKLDENKFTVTSEIKNIEQTNSLIKSSITNLILAMVLCANIIATAILMASEYGPKLGGISIFPILCLVFSMILSLIIVMRILRK
jgi:ubiquinone biosynthesis protein